MRWNINPPQWQRWFAWHPIEMGGQRVWWEWVERKAVYADAYMYWRYRPLTDAQPSES